MRNQMKNVGCTELVGYPCHFEHLYVFARSFRKLDIMLFLKYQFPCFVTQFRLVFNFPSAQIPSIRSLLYLTLVLMPWCFFTRYAQTLTGHPGCHNRAAAFFTHAPWWKRKEWSKGGKPPVDLGFNFNSLGAAIFRTVSEWSSPKFQKA